MARTGWQLNGVLRSTSFIRSPEPSNFGPSHSCTVEPCDPPRESSWACGMYEASRIALASPSGSVANDCDTLFHRLIGVANSDNVESIKCE